MRIRAGREADHAKWHKNNSDPYGGCALKYADAWAALMEAALAEGKSLFVVARSRRLFSDSRDLANELSHEADKAFGVTGFMHGAAVAYLSDVWEHGEELRRWHNLDTQIGDEGEKANAEGGVLNPALISFTSKESR